MGAPGRTARRLKAGLAALFLIALAAALAPQDARAQTSTVTLTATAGNAQVTLNWTPNPVPTVNPTLSWAYRLKAGSGNYGEWQDISGGTAARTHTVTGLTNGTVYTFQVGKKDILPPPGVPNPLYGSPTSNEVTATPTTKTITLSSTSTSIPEGGSGTTYDVTITVTLGEAAPASFTVTVTSDTPLGTAKGSNKGSNPCTPPLNPADTDWCWATTGFVSIAEGETTGTKTLRVLGDTRDEPNETIRLLAHNFGWTSGRLTLTIVDDDGTAKPAKPAGLSAEAGNAQVKLTWTDPDDDSITGYRVQQRKGSAAWESWSDISGSDADTVAHTVTGLDNDSEYRFRVQAQNSSGNSAASAVVRATPTATVPKPVVSAEAGYARVTLSWSALSGVTIASWGYQYKPSGGSWSTTRTVTGASTTSATVTGLTIGTEYTFRLFAAVSPGVQSVWSDEVKATPTNTVPKPVLTAAGGDASVTLSWSALSGIPITSWGYQYKSTGGWSTTTTVTGGSRTSVRVTGLTNGTEYTFRLFAAVRPGVQSVWSDEVTARTDPVAPVLTAATSTTNGQVDLTWTHAGGSNELSDADDYVKDAAKFHWWRAQTRLKGASTWTDRSLNQASARQNPGSRNNRLLLNYPDGASVEVRVRATGYRMAGVSGGTGNLQGPWSNIRTVTFKDDTTAALTLTGTPVTVAPGSTATYTVALTKAYAGTLRVTSDATAAARVSPASLTFTAGNYSTARTVTVTGVANGTATVNHAFRLTGAAADAIPDAGTVDVTVADTPGVTVSTAALTVAEGGSRTYTMRLNTPPSSDVTITVAGMSGDVTVDTDAGMAGNQSALTFTRTNWNEPQTVTVNAAPDGDDVTDGDVTLTHSASGGGYASVTIASVVVSVAEKDASPAKPTGLVATAGDGSVTLRWTDPDNPTIVRWEYQQKAGDDEWGAWTAIPGADAGTTRHEVSGLDNGTAYQFRVRAVNAAEAGPGPGSEASESVTPAVPATPTTPSGGGGGTTPPTTTLTSPAAAGSVTVTPTALTVDEGSSATYTVKLDTAPSAEVTVTVGGASGEVTVAGSPLTFTPANYGTAQTVTVSAGADEDTTDDTATLTHAASSSDPAYGASLAIDEVAVTVTDTTRLPVLTLAQDPAAVTEGEDIRLTVTADRALTGRLTVRLTLAARDGGGFDAGDLAGGLGPRELTAAFGDTASPTGTVTIATVADAEVEGTETYRVTLNDAAGYVVGSDATAAGVLHDTPTESVARANRVHATVLPQVAAAVLSQTLEAVGGRIEAAASCETAGGAVRLGAGPVPRIEAARRPLRGVEPAGARLREVLDGASFTVPLGAGGGGALSVWGRGGRVSLSGAQRGVAWDGRLWSAYVGADLCVRPTLLAGAAVSHTESTLDATTGEAVRSVHESALTAVHPYAAWRLRGGARVWASAGLGAGEVRVAEAGASARAADLTLASAAVGARRVLVEDTGRMAGGATRVVLKGEGAVARAHTDAGDGLVGRTVSTRRVRLALEGAHERPFEGGATLTPALEAGVRYDGGDAAEGVGLEAGARVTWRDPAVGLTAEVRTRALVAHERERDEWGVGALVRLDPGADGRGTFLTFGPSHGRTESGLGQWFDHRLPAAASGTAPEEARSRLEAEVGHGFGLAGAGPLAVLTPWAGLSLAESGGRTLRLGARYRLGAELRVGVEATTRAGTAGEDRLMLRGALRW